MYLGLDLGTSGLRALLVDEDGDPVASASAGCAVAHPRPGWSEQDPGDWIGACREAVGALGHDLSGVRAIGLSGQMHGATLLGADHAPLRPCMLWNDTRAHAQASALDTNRVRELSGNAVFPGFTAPKLMWVRDEEPETFARTALVLLPKDHLRLWLTGEAVSEMSDAAGTSWLDTGARGWSDELLGASGMEARQMPRLVEGSEVSGTLRPASADALSLPAGIPVAGGGGDNAAAAAGLGCLREGDGFVSLGTSGVLLAARDAYTPRPETAVHTFCHAVPGRWYQMGVILAATDALNWLSRIAGRSPAELASAVPVGEAPGHLLFLPYLSGERTPHNDASVRGAFINLDVTHEAPDLARAVMEGVAMALRDSLDALRSAGTDLASVMGTGGGTASEAWVHMLSGALGIQVEMPGAGETGAAMGAARLAMMADGAGDVVIVRPHITRTFEPAHGPAWTDAIARFRAAYPALRPL